MERAVIVVGIGLLVGLTMRWCNSFRNFPPLPWLIVFAIFVAVAFTPFILDTPIEWQVRLKAAVLMGGGQLLGFYLPTVVGRKLFKERRKNEEAT